MEENTLIVETISAVDELLTFEDVITNNLAMENMHLNLVVCWKLKYHSL